ncbi:alpha/beta fold hydrolase [Dolichospermum sp. ST_sed1]|nr:alpha/beta fold hydrolase [Dolichospermum sp. ST_sed1]MDD1423773.1 alpha/beta fold hydrolase [Dolichospermum sp. ST_sed9]MDD1434384.1 alpha/beta fold hydrolase [Dolichospermum sp. ST_sed6]MDD1443678.1 alpha/beta fold hydrolase [Dolichospermum sp. ST_sed3]MDD1447512.1 alpha/beta fold hydrolase [Dolichospermum sp. ST_sed8]MDD1457516.1 alpha/beta fold hydrolase [Dolichospermum sp. ST_sed7]MDD1462770.1 alpha/beta fold hydrolase [Dolichospermum sp. ST_sed2]MDD1467375.1 alpha/beta fold hydrolas
MTTARHWQQRVGNQRDWVWRGWQTRYTYIRPPHNYAKTTPLILLHGFGASIGHWRHNLEVLGKSHTVYALDMIGFGASEKAATNYNVELWVEQVYDFWKTFIGQPVVLVGNSIGSLISLVAAANHPDMVQGIVMMSLPDPTLEQEMISTALQPLVSGIKSIFTSRLILKPLFYFIRRPSVLRPWASLAYANPEAITDELIDILAGPPQDRGSARAFRALFKATTGVNFSPSVKKILPNLTIPMLLIWGKKDRFVPPQLANQFVGYNEKLQLLYLEDVGHCPQDESPEQVNQAILDWIGNWN